MKLEKSTIEINEVRPIRTIIPICMHCKKIRDENGYWLQIEDCLIQFNHSHLSHGICPDCIEKHYPDLSEKDKQKKLHR